ncbi:FAD:protein FMN transferase [Candidatus Woesearchaeota archaeon]|nr:FAD:protein FMN transferase [Candidatus Woesearchaeota archaeon]
MRKITILLLLLVLLTACATSRKTEQTKELMGTVVTITIYHEDMQTAENAIEDAFTEMERVEGLLSSTENTSQLYILNKYGEVGLASPELIYVLSKSLKYGDISEGAFDVTVQPILDLYTHTFTDLGRAPAEQEIKEKLGLVSYEDVFIKKRHIGFTKPGMKITLGGIAKGYIIDRAISVLEEHNISHAIVNAGGDIRVLGNKGRNDWQIALQNPRKKSEHITVISLNNNAVATSGDYERFFDPDKKFHHIVDPRTGYSATELISVTIITGNAIDADALSTAVFVLGKARGMGLIESLDNVEGLIITSDKEILKSSGFEY